LFKKDDTFSEDSHDVQIIMPTFKNRHKEIYDILSAITNGNQTIFLEGNFVEEETVSIQVYQFLFRIVKYQITVI